MKPIITHIDTACCLIQIEELTLLTDPVLDDPGKRYHHGWGAFSRKTSTPIIAQAQLEKVDLVLLSHPQHKDNFDEAGKAFAATVPTVLSTPAIEKILSNGIGMQPWDSHEVVLRSGSVLTITATPAQHHPHWLPGFISGSVIGFMLTHSSETETLYISGDTIYFKGVKQIKERFPDITYALLHAGGVQFPYLTGKSCYTLDHKGVQQMIETLRPEVVIPIHTEGWTHFHENTMALRTALLKGSQQLQKSLHFLETGVAVSLDDLRLQ